MTLTKSQQNIIDRIKDKYHNVEISESDICLIVKFDNGEESIWNRITTMVKIGKRGAVEFLYLDRVCADGEHRKILARLVCSEIKFGLKPTFSKHFTL